MLLGKRQRPPINRTTSLSQITFDLNLPVESEPSDQHHMIPAVDQHRQTRNGLLDQRLLSMVSPRGSLRRHSGDFSDSGHFLRSCSLCDRLLVPGRDIYMYRGDTAFCSSECRQQQMAQDERKEKPAKEKAVVAKSGKGGRGAAAAAAAAAV